MELEAYSTTCCNSFAKEWFHQKSKGNYSYKYSKMLTNTYPRILERITCPEEHWKSQGLVKIVEYFAASFYYFRASHWLRSESSWILCAFISEGGMFLMLQGLYSTTHKRKYYMVSSNSFLLQRGKSIKEACYLTTTRPRTCPISLDHGGARSSLSKWRFKVSDMKPKTFPLDSFARWLIG